MPPLILYHGTINNYIPSIIQKGLIKGNRMHVHLSADIETAQRGKQQLIQKSAVIHFY